MQTDLYKNLAIKQHVYNSMRAKASAAGQHLFREIQKLQNQIKALNGRNKRKVTTDPI